MRGSAWVNTFSLASRGIIEKKTVISSERADTKDSRAPSEATQDSEQNKNKPGIGGLREEPTASLVDKKKYIAEGDSSNLARKGTLDVVPSNGGIMTPDLSSERATEDHNRLVDDHHNEEIGDEGTAEGESSNLADKPVQDVYTIPLEDQICDGEAAKIGVLQDKCKQVVEKSINILSKMGTSKVVTREEIEASKDPERMEDSEEAEQNSEQEVSKHSAGQEQSERTGERCEQNRKKEDVACVSETSDETTKKLKSNNSEKEKPVASEVPPVDCDSGSGGVNRGEKPGLVQDSEIEDHSMRLGVVLIGFPDDKMSKEQAEVVKATLVGMINPADHGEPVKFSSAQYKNGGLVFACDNNTTKVWLHKKVPMLVPWPGARLAVGAADLTLKGTQLVLWLKGLMRKRGNRQVLDLLQKQNKVICTAEWKVLRRVTERERDRLTLWIDEKSFKDLKARSFMLFLGSGISRLMPWLEWKRLLANSILAKPLPTNRHPPPKYKFTNYKPPTPRNFYSDVPVSHASRFVDPNLPRPREPRFVSQNPAPHSELLYTPSHFHAGWLTDQNESLPKGQRYIEAAKQLVRKSRSNLSGQAHLPQSWESRYSDQPQEPGYVASDYLHPHDTGYFVSEHYQPHETGYVVSDHIKPHEARYRSSDHPSPRETLYVASDQPPTREHRYDVLDQALSHELRYVDQSPPRKLSPRETVSIPSERPHSRGHRYDALDHALSHELRYIHEPSQETVSIPSDRSCSGKPRYHALDHGLSHELRYIYEPLPRKLPHREIASISPERSPSRKHGYDALDHASSHELRCIDEPRPRKLPHREIASISHNRSPSRKHRYHALDHALSHELRYIDEHHQETVSIPSDRSPSGKHRCHALDLAVSKELRYIDEQRPRKLPRRETASISSDRSPSRKHRYHALDRALSHELRHIDEPHRETVSIPSDRSSSRKHRYHALDRALSYKLRHIHNSPSCSSRHLPSNERRVRDDWNILFKI